MITKATKEQWDEIEQCRQWWIDQQTVQPEYEEVARSVQEVFALAMIKMPFVIMTDSPLTAINRDRQEFKCISE